MNRIIQTAFVFTFSLILLSCSSGGSQTESKETSNTTLVFKDLSAPEFKEQTTSTNSIILDVRTEDEVQEGKIPGAIHIDIFNPDFNQQIETLDHSKTILVYCASGGRSSRASRQLQAAGFTTVYNLKGGFNGWLTLGYPSE